MSTRSQIGFYETAESPIEQKGQVFIYKHSDEYPEGVIQLLKPFVQMFALERGLDDIAYATARCVQMLTNKSDKSLADIGASRYKLLGYGLDTVLHADIEYFYFVCPTELRVYIVTCENPKGWQLSETVKIKSREAVS